MFSYTVAEGDEDTDGLNLDADSLALNGGGIADGSDNPAELDHPELPDRSGQQVDGVRPSLAATDEAVVRGARLTLTYDEPLDGSSAPPAGDFGVTVAGERRDVAAVAVAGSTVALTLASPVVRGQAVTVTYTVAEPGTAKPIRDPAGNTSPAFTNQAVTNRTEQETERTGRTLPAKAVKQIQAILAAKARRTPAQRKVSSQLLDARRRAAENPVSDPDGSRAAPGSDALQEPVTVDIRAEVTPQVLARIRTLGGTVINSVPRYRSIRAQLPLGAVETLAELDAVQSIRTADKAITRESGETPSSGRPVGCRRRSGHPQGGHDRGRRRHRATGRAAPTVSTAPASASACSRMESAPGGAPGFGRPAGPGDGVAG